VLARLLTYLPTVALAVLISYFTYHAVTGDQSVLTTRQRQATLAEDEAHLAALRAQSADLEQQVRLLSDQSLSIDLLEERAHVLLGFADPRDYVIRTPPDAR
jgi:cell division protein FtsB